MAAAIFAVTKVSACNFNFLEGVSWCFVFMNFLMKNEKNTSAAFFLKIRPPPGIPCPQLYVASAALFGSYCAAFGHSSTGVGAALLRGPSAGRPCGMPHTLDRCFCEYVFFGGHRYRGGGGKFVVTQLIIKN